MLMTNHVNYVFIHQELVIPRCSSGSPHRAVQASVGADAGTHILHTTPPLQCGSAPPRPAPPPPAPRVGWVQVQLALSALVTFTRHQRASAQYSWLWWLVVVVAGPACLLPSRSADRKSAWSRSWQSSLDSQISTPAASRTAAATTTTT